MSVKHERREAAIFRDLTQILANLSDPVASTGTITEVKLTRDNSLVKVYIAIIGNDYRQDKVLEALNAAKGHIRSELAQSYKGYKVPEIRFEIDETFEHARRITDLLSKV